MYGVNAANTGQSRLIGIASRPTVRWETNLTDPSPFPRNLALSADGVLYVVGDALYALDSRDGRLVWNEPLGWRDSRAALDAQGRLYAFESGRLQARDAVNGSLLWTGEPGFVSDGEPVKIGPTGIIDAPELR